LKSLEQRCVVVDTNGVVVVYANVCVVDTKRGVDTFVVLDDCDGVAVNSRS
jgi:hypothetical protein